MFIVTNHLLSLLGVHFYLLFHPLRCRRETVVGERGFSLLPSTQMHSIPHSGKQRCYMESREQKPRLVLVLQACPSVALVPPSKPEVRMIYLSPETPKLILAQIWLSTITASYKRNCGPFKMRGQGKGENVARLEMRTRNKKELSSIRAFSDGSSMDCWGC